MKINRGFVLLSISVLLFVSCVTHDVSFKGESEIRSDGTVIRKGRMEIRISGDREDEIDSLKLSEFFIQNYVVPGESHFEVERDYKDNVMTIYWRGTIGTDDGAVSDYIHKSADGQMAINRIIVDIKDRWIYKDITYSETFSDPVDTVAYFPVIKEKLAKTSDNMTKQRAVGEIRDIARVEGLLNGMETTGGLDLFRSILAEPDRFDSISDLYEKQIYKTADSLAGFEGVKLSIDSLEKVIRYYYDAAWDTLLADYPGLFGSFGIGDEDTHNFIIEVDFPGCLISSNADTTVGKTSTWSFNQLDFFAGKISMELTTRVWAWVNMAISAMVVVLIFLGIFIPVRKGR